MELVKRLKARVVKGRLVLDEPTDLPEGTEIELIAADELDELAALDPEERDALEESLSISEEQIARGETLPIDETLRKLRPPE